MLFNSINYSLFLSAVFVLNYSLPNRFRWVLLLSASIFFYLIAGAASFFVPVIIILTTFISGILIDNTSNLRKKKRYFFFGIFINLGLLIFFKYINFFIATFFEGFHFLKNLIGAGQDDSFTLPVLQIVVPLGISYITFQAIGYLIEIKRGNHKSERNLGLFATYILFFPKLLSGPIERAHYFIPQLSQKHEFDNKNIVEGLKRILWGLFLKLVIANRIAIYTDVVFNNYSLHSGLTLLVASIFFTIQLFADFAGYTDIAIGSALILGFRLMENFNRPFLSKSITEFWRRWHISLTSWVNEYIYNPIVIHYRSWNKWAVVFAVIITFLILGFWHGANWNYIFFGFLQGIALSIELLSRRFRKIIRSKIPVWLNSVMGIGITFGYFCFSAIFFKVNNIKEAFSIVGKIFTFNGPFYIGTLSFFIYSLLGIFILIIKDFTDEYTPSKFLLFNSERKVIRFFSYGSIIILILLIGVFDGGQFIYFQF